MTTKYTADVLRPLLLKSSSFNELARLVGIAPTGSNTTNLKRRCIQHNLDISHMTGQRHMKGKIAFNKKHFSWFLVEGTSLDRRLEARTLRRAMIESGIKYECAGESCILTNMWYGKPLKLHIDHVDGKHWNNRKENLRFLCPNCHTQTETWGK